TGVAAAANLNGITVNWDISSSYNTIGGTTPAARNLISGNVNNGIAIGASGHDVIQGNLIGTDVTGAQPLPNGFRITVNRDNNIIGGTAAGAGNTIAFNHAPAVSVNGTGNAIEGNSIYGNNDINGSTGPAIDNLGQSGFNLGPTFIDTNWPGGPFTGT